MSRQHRDNYKDGLDVEERRAEARRGPVAPGKRTPASRLITAPEMVELGGPRVDRMVDSAGARRSDHDDPSQQISAGFGVDLDATRGADADPPAAMAKASQSSGTPLPDGVRGGLERASGEDLSGVRVHMGSASQRAAKAIGAKAYTVGQDIHFAPGTYDLTSNDGQHLIAHEVAHTVQQRGASAAPQAKLEVSSPGDAREREADAFAERFVRGEPAGDVRLSQVAAKTIARTPADRAGTHSASSAPAMSTGAGLQVSGYSFTTDPQQVRQELRRAVTEIGRDRTSGIVFGVVRKASSDPHPLQHPDPNTDLQAVQHQTPAAGVHPIVSMQWRQLDREIEQFLRNFEQEGKRTADQMLDESEQKVRTAVERYGLTWTPEIEALFAPHVDASNPNPVQFANDLLRQAIDAMAGRLQLAAGTGTEAADNSAMFSLQSSAADLGRTQAVRDHDRTTMHRTEMIARFSSGPSGDGTLEAAMIAGLRESGVLPPADMLAVEGASPAAINMVDAINRRQHASAARHAGNQLQAEQKHPILAAFRDDQQSLDALTSVNPSKVSETLVRKVLETIGNIRKARVGLATGHYSVWKLDRVMQATSARLDVAAGSMEARVVADKARDYREDEAWMNLVKNVLIVGVGIALSLPTGGGAIAMTARVGGAALDAKLAADQYQDYAFDKAAAGSDFDRAKALMQEEPSLAWLVVDLVSAGLGIAAVARAVREARALKQAVEAGDLPQAQVIRDGLNDIGAAHKKPGLGDEVAGRVDAQGGRAGRHHRRDGVNPSPASAHASTDGPTTGLRSDGTPNHGAIRSGRTSEGVARLTAHPNAHTLTRHGGSVTDDQLIARARQGVAPDGHLKIGAHGDPVLPPVSSAFHSDDLAVLAERTLRDGPLRVAAAADPTKTVITVSGDIGVDVGRGYSRIGGSRFRNRSGPLRYHPSMTRARATFELDPATGEWYPITVFPDL